MKTCRWRRDGRWQTWPRILLIPGEKCCKINEKKIFFFCLKIELKSPLCFFEILYFLDYNKIYPAFSLKNYSQDLLIRLVEITRLWFPCIAKKLRALYEVQLLENFQIQQLDLH